MLPLSGLLLKLAQTDLVVNLILAQFLISIVPMTQEGPEALFVD